jgi:hypothetical protein
MRKELLDRRHRAQKLNKKWVQEAAELRAVPNYFNLLWL